MTDGVRKAAAVAVVGSLHYDILVSGADRPRRGETLFGEAWAPKCGGKGGNQAIEAARHGAATAIVGAVGEDEFGDALLSRLGEALVDTTEVFRLANIGSGISVALFDSDGDYGAVIVPGANWGMTSAMIEDCRVVEDCRVLLLQNELRPETNLAAATIARKGGAKIVLNAAPARTLSDGLTRLVDLLVVNEIEAEMLAGCPPVSGFEAAEVAAAAAARPSAGGVGDAWWRWIAAGVPRDLAIAGCRSFRCRGKHARRGRCRHRRPSGSTCRRRAAGERCALCKCSRGRPRGDAGARTWRPRPRGDAVNPGHADLGQLKVPSHAGSRPPKAHCIRSGSWPLQSTGYFTSRPDNGIRRSRTRPGNNWKISTTPTWILKCPVKVADPISHGSLRIGTRTFSFSIS